MSETNIVLEAKGITKQFPGVLANDNVNFDLRKGEIHALLGENGAGKSTLMNLIYGLHLPDKGEVIVNGKNAIDPFSKRLHRAWHWHGTSTLHADPRIYSCGKRHAWG